MLLLDLVEEEDGLLVVVVEPDLDLGTSNVSWSGAGGGYGVVEMVPPTAQMEVDQTLVWRWRSRFWNDSSATGAGGSGIVLSHIPLDK